MRQVAKFIARGLGRFARLLAFSAMLVSAFGKPQHVQAVNAGFAAPYIPGDVCGLPLATWTMDTSQGTGSPPDPFYQAADVATASAAAGSGITASIDTTIGNPVNSWEGYGFSTSANESDAVTNNDFFEFTADTSNYTGISFTFEARLDGVSHGPASLRLHSSTDGTTFTAYATPISPTTSFATYDPAGSAAGATHFRIYGYDAFNAGADAKLFLDNISITGCRPGIELEKNSTTTSIAAAGAEVPYTFAVTNEGDTFLTGISVEDPLCDAPAAGGEKKYDFGTDDSSLLAAGYTAVTHTTAYAADFGWTVTSGLASRDRGAPDDLLRDLVFHSLARIFKVDLPNGSYSVNVRMGDQTAP
ncbi:MAG TPA: hypothetical protein VLY63_11480, partial [Anaerolineae bacterium]|nr:hypothetical protein [Anaerolineae bacterium]